MKLNVSDTLSHPREMVWSTYRDELDALATYLPNIKRVETLEREEPEAGIIKLFNEWHAKGEIPAIAQRFIKPEMLRWRERVVWDQNTWVCSWKIEPAFFTEHLLAEGQTSYLECPGDRTEIRIAGTLEVDARGFKGVPRLMAKPVGKAVEKLFCALVLPNMQRLNRSLGTYLDEKKAKG